jgi:Pentapeptide repeats (9 copies)
MKKEEIENTYNRGKAAWNKWAEILLNRKKTMEESGKWTDEARNEWREEAKTDFREYFSSDKTGLHQPLYREELDFSGFIFPGEVDFSEMEKFFDGTTFFNGAQFHGDVLFQGTEFLKSAFFEKAVFYCDAFFNGVTFRQPAFFNGAKFYGNAFFNGAKFLGDVSFRNATFKGLETSFVRACFQHSCCLCDEPALCVDFSGINVDRTFLLTHTEFKIVPNFVQAHFLEAPTLKDLKFESTTASVGFWTFLFKGKATERDSRSYHALRRLAAQSNDLENELFFLKGELRSRRICEGGWSHVPSIFYDLCSDYGKSLCRPFAFLCLNFLFFLVWNCVDYKELNKTIVALGNCGIPITIHNIFINKCLIPQILENTFVPIIPSSSSPSSGTGFIFQKLLSTIGWFLLLLGLRNQFKMK